jgi:hypothetical protein
VDDNSYQPPTSNEPSRDKDRGFVLTIAIMATVSLGLGLLLTPADPVSMWIGSGVIFVYSFAWYMVGRRQRK